MSLRALGVDIGSSSIKIAEVEAVGNKRQIIGLYELPRNGEQSVQSILQDFFAVHKVQGERLSVGLGNIPMLFTRHSLPISNRADALAAIRGELEDTLPFDLSSYILDFKPLRKVGRITEYMSGLADEKAVRDLSTMFEAAGVVPDALIADGEALAQLALHQMLPASENGVYVVCDIGHGFCNIAILKGHRGHLFDRKVKALPESEVDILELRLLSRGSDDLIQWISNKKKISIDETKEWLAHRAEIKNPVSGKGALSDEISDEIKTALRPVVVEIYQTLQAFRGKKGENPQRLYLTGGLTLLKGFREFLSQELRMPVEDWNVFSGFDSSEVQLNDHRSHTFGLAVALAHRHLVPKSKGWLNFRRSSQEHRKFLSRGLEALSKPETRPVLGFVVLFLVFLYSYMFAAQFFLEKQMINLRRDLVSEFRQLDPDLGKKAAKFTLSSKRAKEQFAKEKSARMAQLKSEGSDNLARAKLDFLLDVSEVLPPDAKVNSIEVDPSNTKAMISSKVTLANSPSPADLSRISKDLSNELSNRGYGNVKFSETKAPEFTLQASWVGFNEE